MGSALTLRELPLTFRAPFFALEAVHQHAPASFTARTSADALLTLKSARARRFYLQHSGQVAQLVEQRTENPRVDGSIPPLATIIRRPTSVGWVFSFLDSSMPRGVARRSVCATSWWPGVRKSPGSTLFCFLFYQNLRRLLRRNTRRQPFASVACACVTAIGWRKVVLHDQLDREHQRTVAQDNQDPRPLPERRCGQQAHLADVRNITADLGRAAPH